MVMLFLVLICMFGLMLWVIMMLFLKFMWLFFMFILVIVKMLFMCILLVILIGIFVMIEISFSGLFLEILVFLFVIKVRFFFGLVGSILFVIVKFFFFGVVGICLINSMLGLMLVNLLKLCMLIVLFLWSFGFFRWFFSVLICGINLDGWLLIGRWFFVKIFFVLVFVGNLNCCCNNFFKNVCL